MTDYISSEIDLSNQVKSKSTNDILEILLEKTFAEKASKLQEIRNDFETKIWTAEALKNFDLAQKLTNEMKTQIDIVEAKMDKKREDTLNAARWRQTM